MLFLQFNHRTFNSYTCLYFFLQYKNTTRLWCYFIWIPICVSEKQRNRSIFAILLNYKEVKIFATSKCRNMTDYLINCSSWGHLSSVDEQQSFSSATSIVCVISRICWTWILFMLVSIFDKYMETGSKRINV